MKKFTESINNITKTKKEELIYFDLFPLLRGLESERPGIKDRIWGWMRDEWDVAFKPYNGRISFINLYYYGIGDEYPTKYLEEYPDEIDTSKSNHPEAFKDGTKESELRKDLNLIMSVYQDDIDDSKSRLGSSVEMFAVMVFW